MQATLRGPSRTRSCYTRPRRVRRAQRARWARTGRGRRRWRSRRARTIRRRWRCSTTRLPPPLGGAAPPAALHAPPQPATLPESKGGPGRRALPPRVLSGLAASLPPYQPDTPRPFPLTKWTRRVPPRVLRGHAASLPLHAAPPPAPPTPYGRAPTPRPGEGPGLRRASRGGARGGSGPVETLALSSACLCAQHLSDWAQWHPLHARLRALRAETPAADAGWWALLPSAQDDWCPPPPPPSY